FEAYWEVPASEKTAVNGRWVKGPGERLFLKLREALGGLPIIAEDLGVITPEVEALRDGFALPGMRILQFGFGDDPTNVYLPHNFDKNCVVYTGTHDNETTVGWFHGLSDREKGVVRKYLGEGPDQIPWSLIRLAFSSVASLAVIPAQDLLGLGCEARMNSPGRASGNWGWRLRPGALTADVGKRLLSLAKVYGRA
ncbi:MAG: 4-alpha-glucanotransferase, partial [Candidatus Riflebacteria bacterium]|nr:4-alpha-glucanotransferase [Candidatus Riflebacteria bacterium]